MNNSEALPYILMIFLSLIFGTMATDRLKQQDERIKRLEQAGDEMAKWLEDIRNLGADATLSHAWNKAKEAKP